MGQQLKRVVSAVNFANVNNNGNSNYNNSSNVNGVRPDSMINLKPVITEGVAVRPGFKG